MKHWMVKMHQAKILQTAEKNSERLLKHSVTAIGWSATILAPRSIAQEEPGAVCSIHTPGVYHGTDQ